MDVFALLAEMTEAWERRLDRLEKMLKEEAQ
jgi:hypothetical protein